MVRIAVGAVVLILLVGCASCPRGVADAPMYHGTKPTEVIARVDAFRDVGAFIDFPDNFVKYHSAILVTEGEVGWKTISLQYQGEPMLNGHRLELGERIRFTLPATTNGGCCEPYLRDIADAVFLDVR